MPYLLATAVILLFAFDNELFIIQIADQVKDIDKGKFIEDRNVMCYIACIYQMTQIVSTYIPNHQK